MSMDYPFYEELCRRKHRAAWWWLIGDRLYYLGLIPAMISVAAACASVIALLLDWEWGSLLASAITFIISVIVFLIGGSLKRHSYVLARRDGIDVGW